MDTMLVRLKPYDPRRGHVLRRFTFAGIKIHEERGWYRVTADIATYLQKVRQVPGDEYSPFAFDVCTEEEAKALEEREEAETKVRRGAADNVRLSPARSEGPPTALPRRELPKTPDSPRARSHNEPRRSEAEGPVLDEGALTTSHLVDPMKSDADAKGRKDKG